MTLTRRLFASLIPAAPAVAVHGINQFGEKMAEAYPSNPSLAGMMGNKIVRAVAPPQLKQYYEAMESTHKFQRNHYRMLEYRRNQNNMNMNIVALKSVSPQHKILMQMKRDEEEEKKQQSFRENLIDSLGLRDWFKERELDNSPRQSANVGGY